MGCRTNWLPFSRSKTRARVAESINARLTHFRLGWYGRLRLQPTPFPHFGPNYNFKLYTLHASSS